MFSDDARQKEEPEFTLEVEEETEEPLAAPEIIPRPTEVLAPTLVGWVSATRFQPATADSFYFRVAHGVTIRPFDFVLVRDNTRRVIGQVVEVGHYTDAESHLDSHASGGLGTQAATLPRISFEIAHVEVITPVPEETTEPVGHDQEVHRLHARELAEVLERRLPPESTRVVVGLVSSGSTVAPLHIDSEMLVGPDGVHALVAGKTRLAGKTSYLLFLLLAIREPMPDIRTVIFNVKMSDLLQLHRLRPFLENPQTQPQADEQYRRLWGHTGLQLAPFPPQCITYLLPRGSGSNRVASDPANLPGGLADCTTIARKSTGANYSIFRYSVSSAAGRLRDLLGAVTLTDAQERFVEALDRRGWRIGGSGARGLPASFQEFYDALQTAADNLDNGVIQSFYTASDARTIRIVASYIRRLTQPLGRLDIFDWARPQPNTQAQGLSFVIPHDFVKGLSPGAVAVIDIYPFDPALRAWIVGSVLEAIEGVDAPFAILVDELPDYAPSGGSETPVRSALARLAVRGGASRHALFGAGSYASRVHTDVWAAAATRAFGLTDPTEAADDAYRLLSRELKARLAYLKRGELLLASEAFGRVIPISFPPPCVRKLEDASIP